MSNHTPYTEFSAYLLQVVLANLPPDIPKTWGNAKHELACLPEKLSPDHGIPLDKSAINAWLHGQIKGSKPLTEQNIRKILEYYYGKRGLKTVAAVRYWLSMGPSDFLVLLDDFNFKQWTRGRQIPEGEPVWRQQWVPRPRVWAQIEKHLQLDLKNQSREHPLGPKVLVLHGPPGIGKTTLLDMINASPLAHLYYDQVVTLRPDNSNNLDEWLHLLFTRLSPEKALPKNKADLGSILSRQLIKQKILFLLDSVEATEPLKAFTTILPPNCQVVVTTSQTAVTLIAEPDAVVHVPALDWNETVALARSPENEGIAIDDAELKNLADAVRYNPLGLHLALRLTAQRGYEAVLSELLAPPLEEDSGVQRELLAPVRMAYEILHPDQRRAFAKLGALPRLRSYDLPSLAALWNAPTGHAWKWAEDLRSDARLLERAGNDWGIHDVVLKYAIYKFASLPAPDQEDAREWQERYLETTSDMVCDVNKYADQDWDSAHTETRKKFVKKFEGADYGFGYLVCLAARELFCPETNLNWKVFQAFQASLPVQVYGMGARLYQQERKENYTVRRMAALLGFATLVAFGLMAFGQQLADLLLEHLDPLMALIVTCALGLVLLGSMLYSAVRGIRLTWQARERQRLWAGLWKMSDNTASEIAPNGKTE
ncbi:MAG: ATP-binding protein [Anaerolineales bacterium]|nr:ATP-binding protein [Anaerolineales bacterium]